MIGPALQVPLTLDGKICSLVLFQIFLIRRHLLLVYGACSNMLFDQETGAMCSACKQLLRYSVDDLVQEHDEMTPDMSSTTKV